MCTSRVTRIMSSKYAALKCCYIITWVSWAPRPINLNKFIFINKFIRKYIYQQIYFKIFLLTNSLENTFIIKIRFSRKIMTYRVHLKFDLLCGN